MTDSVTELPFNKFIGICTGTSGESLLELPPGDQYLNHVGTVHAGAQLALAEACSGEFLRRCCDSADNILPVVRRVEAKFRKPATGRLSANVVTQKEAVDAVLAEINDRGRALLTVSVQVHDESGTHVLSANVEWFLARR